MKTFWAVLGFSCAVLGVSILLATAVTHYCHASPMPPKKLKIQKFPAIEEDGTAQDIPSAINCGEVSCVDGGDAIVQMEEDDESWDAAPAPTVIEDLSMRRLFIKMRNNEAILKNLKEVDPE